MDENDIYFHADSSLNSFELLRTMIHNINRKEIHSYYLNNSIDDVIVYSSKQNIEKIKQNNDHYITME